MGAIFWAEYSLSATQSLWPSLASEKLTTVNGPAGMMSFHYHYTLVPNVSPCRHPKVTAANSCASKWRAHEQLRSSLINQPGESSRGMIFVTYTRRLWRVTPGMLFPSLPV